MLVAVMVAAVAFGFINGLHDAGNAIAAPVVTRSLSPGAAVSVAAIFHVVGALTAGTAVAATVAGIVTVPAGQLLAVVGAATVAATAWSLLTLWLGLPCSSGHSLVGALAGAGLAAGGTGAVRWGGLHGVVPDGVVGSLAWLAFSSALAVPLSIAAVVGLRRSLRRASREVELALRRVQVVTTALLAYAHGSNDAQKTMGLLAVALVADRQLPRFAVPWWVAVTAGAALTLGTSLGGWRVVATMGRGIYPLRTLDGAVSQGSAGLVVLAASLVGAPVSTTDVVAPAIVGVGAGERWHHVRWGVVGQVGAAWLVTLPAAGLLAAASVPLWRLAG